MNPHLKIDKLFRGFKANKDNILSKTKTTFLYENLKTTNTLKSQHLSYLGGFSKKLENTVKR